MEYSVTFRNESANYGDVCIYQEDPNLDIDVMSLAWLTKSANPMTTVKFTWNTDYIFVWDESGELQPGTKFKSSENIDAGLNTNNMVELSYENDAFKFKNLQTNPDMQGDLYIVQNSSIPLNKALVGIGMSGFGTFVKQAQPNMNLFFRPRPKYWISFGKYLQGEVLDITRITNKALLEYGPNIYSLTATLKQDNSWEIVPSV